MTEEAEPTLPVAAADVPLLQLLLMSRIAGLSGRMKQLPVGHLGRTSVEAELETLANLQARLDELVKTLTEDADEE